jgi:hypothetical protein
LGGASGTPNSASSIINSLNLVYSYFPVRFVHQKVAIVMEQAEIYEMLYLGMCDTRSLKPGDIFVETGPTLADTPDGRVFALADVQPLLPAVFARVEDYCALTRPDSESGASDPIQGQAPYQGETKFTEAICSLVEGSYQIPGTTTPTVIPMGVQPHRRMGSSQEFKYPTATHRGLYFGYAPLLPGIQIEPGDVVSDQNGNRYVIHVPSTFTTGIKGWLLQMESLFT